MKLKKVHGKKYEAFWNPLWNEYFTKHALKPLTEADVAGGMDEAKQRELIKKVRNTVTILRR